MYFKNLSDNCINFYRIAIISEKTFHLNRNSVISIKNITNKFINKTFEALNFLLELKI